MNACPRPSCTGELDENGPLLVRFSCGHDVPRAEYDALVAQALALGSASGAPGRPFAQSDSPPKGGEKKLGETNRPPPRVLVFAPISRVAAAAPAAPDWLLEGYCAAGSVTGLVSRPKDGKSELTFGFLAALRDGEPFLGRPTRAARAVLLTEERAGTVREKQERWAIGDHVDVLLRHEARGVAWDEVVRQAVEHCQQVGAALLVADTFNTWAGLVGDAENSAGAMLEAAEPLLWAAGQGLAVWAPIHRRKSGGELGESIRGSSALAGALDIIVELERPKADVAEAGTTRVLRAVSRFQDTPPDLVIRLTDDGYVACGDMPHARAADERERVLAALDGTEATADAVAATTGVPRGSATRRLNELLAAGRVAQRGAGVKADPYVWRIAPEPSDPLPNLVHTVSTFIPPAHNPRGRIESGRIPVAVLDGRTNGATNGHAAPETLACAHCRRPLHGYLPDGTPLCRVHYQQATAPVGQTREVR